MPAVQNNEVSTAQTLLANLESQEAAAVASVLQSYESSRPYSSKTSWKGKQEEFIRWCSAKGYPSDAVNANKFILFLQEIKDRPSMKRGRKRKTNLDSPIAANDQSNLTPIGYRTHQQYVCAIMNLWNQQWARNNS